MLKIRLRRVGGKKQPSYRLVVTDIGSPRDGAFSEIIGSYNPLTNPETVAMNEERARHWVKQGAMPSPTAARLLAKAGIIEKRPQPATRPEPAPKAGQEEKVKPEEKP